MDEPTWKDYRLFELSEMLDSATNPPPIIVALVGPISREIAEKSMLPYWLGINSTIIKWERANFEELVDIGGES